MDPQRWLDEVRKELQTRRLPRRYVTRLMRELSDHVRDGWETPMNKDVQNRPGPLERLGSPRVVAESAEREIRSRSFAARHPVWTFGVFPPLLFLVLAVTFFIGPGAILFELFDAAPLEQSDSSPWNVWEAVLARSYIVGCIVLASVLVVLAFSGLAKRSALARRWPMTAAIVTALLCGCLWTSATAKTPDQMGVVMVGLLGPLWPWRITFPQVIQFVIPLGAAAWVTRRRPSAAAPSVEMRTAA